ncbi:MAG: hypothetical protein HZA54_20005 [Planctomycetes bacterium]|nr:hypothetical protein [Planctomycetota bacterium]
MTAPAARPPAPGRAAPPPPVRIGDLIEVPPVRTVVRLEEGLRAARETCAGFVFTDEVARHVAALAACLLADHGRGILLRGDFGAGKSHFLAALGAWLAGAPDAAALTAAHPDLARVAASGRRFLPVPVSLVNFRGATALEEILIGAIERQLAAAGRPTPLSPLGRFLAHLREVLRAPGLAPTFAAAQGIAPATLDDWLAADPRRAYSAGSRFLEERGHTVPAGLLEEKSETLAGAVEAVRRAGFHGPVLLIDELSEFLQSKPDPARLNEDARTLQLLGETAAETPLWIVAAVQEGLESVGDIAGPTLRKIKDRFPVLLRLSTLHVRDLIERRLVRKRPAAEAEIRRIHENYRACFPGFDSPLADFYRIYPIHPATLALLEGLGALFSQHRGIVDFVHARLGGDPERGIPGILDRPAAMLLAPDAIYEHFAPRLAEFSDFNVYPRHIVPHLDAAIAQAIPAEADRALARRLVRMLVLYALHPTARPPSVRGLAELAACMLAAHDPDLNAGFVAEAVLEPLAGASPFLIRREGASGDPLDRVYAISREEDHARTLRARVERIAAGLAPEDTRLVREPLATLPASAAWPGPLADLLPGRAPVRRAVSWRHTRREAVIVWGEPGGEAELARHLEAALAPGGADFAVVLAPTALTVAVPHVAVWRLPAPRGDEAKTLREGVALARTAAALAPGNPADAPLMAEAEEARRRAEPAIHAALLSILYAGEFAGRALPVDPAARALRRFQRLLEAAGELLLEERYPRFKEVAPGGVGPAPRLFSRLVQELLVPGSLPLAAARASGLTEAVESLAVPLGLVEIKAGAFRLAPDPAGHPLLGLVFALLKPGAAAALADVRRALEAGPFGLPPESAGFLLVALAHAGLIRFLSGERRVPVEFVDPLTLAPAISVALGEQLSREDRELLVQACRFLAPPAGWEAFGLRAQREAWQAAVRFKGRAEELLATVGRALEQAARYPAFAALDLGGAVAARLVRLASAVEEIKVSHGAQEGLERFLHAWRAAGLADADVAWLERLQIFFTGFAEEFVFIAHYVRHAAVEGAIEGAAAGAGAGETGGGDAELARRVRVVREFYERPEERIVADGGTALRAAFGSFRERYVAAYREGHAARQAAAVRRGPAPGTRRAVELVRRLAAIGPLDRPPGLEALLARLEAPAGRAACRANLDEELLRSPLCGCGFVVGDAPAGGEEADPGPAIAECLGRYREILAQPRVLEAVRARAYALEHADAGATERLRRLAALVADPAGASDAGLLDRLDDATVADLARALAGGTRMEERSLGDLARTLGGRRLGAGKVLDQVREWVGNVPEGTLLALTGAAAGGADAGAMGAAGAGVAWWARLHGEVLGEAAPAEEQVTRDAAALGRILEARFPAEEVGRRLARLATVEIGEFLAREPLHTGALRAAWRVLAERVLRDPRELPAGAPASAHVVAAEAAALRERLATLGDYAARVGRAFPERLCARPALARLLADAWGTRELAESAERAIERLAAAGEDWLATLPPVPAFAPEEPCTVLVIAGVAPDVWLAAGEGAAPGAEAAGGAPVAAGTPAAGADTASREPSAAAGWYRLETEPRTAPSLAALFGFAPDRDPSEEFAARGVQYVNLEGHEARPLADLLPEPPRDRAAVVRLARLDAAGHAGVLALGDMPEALRCFLERQLPGLVRAARARGRRFVMTTDHGLSLTRKGLTHGRGGVFERAIYRRVWR